MISLASKYAGAALPAKKKVAGRHLQFRVGA